MKKYIILKIKKNPKLLYIFAFLYNLAHFNFFFLKSFNGNSFVKKGAFIKSLSIVIAGKNNKVVFQPGSRIKNSKIFIQGSNCTISVGPNCIINNTDFWIEDNIGSIVLGPYTSIEGAHLAVTEGKEIKIGNDCMFSTSIQVRTGDSHPIFDMKTSIRINEADDVVIGNHVWIGANASVLKGVRINDGAIIGTGSIVTTSIENNCIYAGIPAKKVKENINWERDRS